MKLSEASIIELLDGLKQGRFTSRELVEVRLHNMTYLVRSWNIAC